MENERDIAKKAEQMLTSALNQKISSLNFKEHFESNNKNLGKDSFAVADYKPGKSANGGLRWYMNKLSIKMPRHGFIQHYGDNGVREGGNRTRHIPKTTTYKFATHYWRLPAKDYIDDAIKQSGVIPFVMENITEIRSKEIVIRIQNFLQDK